MAGRILSILLLLGLAAVASAQNILPSNATIPPPVSGVQLRLYLQGGRPNTFQTTYYIAPLTESAGLLQSATSINNVKIQGVLTQTNANNVRSIGRGDIAYISCDPDPTNTSTTMDVITAAAAQSPAIAGILLYSLTSVGCHVNGSSPYGLYTMTNATESQVLLGIFPIARGNPISAEISSESTTPSRNASTSNADNNGSAPTTAVAMSILYAITGIITLLFLIIIGTGALRAHRNPERYGPRRALGGRPRQSRAKGLARAMLETIPIVKFGDPEPVKPGHRDTELEDGNSTHIVPPATETDANKVKSTEPEMTPPTVPIPAAGVSMASGMGTAESVKSGDEAAPRDGEVECSICTEAFTAGEDVRVLPCQHKFHPACIDPWLLNVSGTCPLCRHDLNPAEAPAEEPAEGTTPADGELPPPLTPETQPESDTSPGRRRISRFLDLHGLRTAPPQERIAALRRLREETRAEGAAAPEVQVEQPGSSNRHRLRDRFRIGSRSQPTATGEAPVTRESPSATVAPQTETRDETPR